MQNFEIFHFIRVPSCQEAILMGKKGKNCLGTSFLNFFNVFHHQMGRIKVSGAAEQWFGCRILRSFIFQGSQGLIFSKNDDSVEKCSKIGTLGGPKVEKKVKCLTKWVRLAPIELKLCRNDQAMIRTSILLILANFSQFVGEKVEFSFPSPLCLPQNLAFFPYFPVQTAGPHIST